MVRPIGAPIPFQTLLAPVARHSFFSDFYEASIRAGPQDSQDEKQGQGAVPVKHFGVARRHPQSPHGRRRIVSIARTSRVPSQAFLAHRGEVGGAVALDVR